MATLRRENAKRIFYTIFNRRYNTQDILQRKEIIRHQGNDNVVFDFYRNYLQRFPVFWRHQRKIVIKLFPIRNQKRFSSCLNLVSVFFPILKTILSHTEQLPKTCLCISTNTCLFWCITLYRIKIRIKTQAQAVTIWTMPSKFSIIVITQFNGIAFEMEHNFGHVFGQ